jgi:hypothetical protein
MKATPRHNRPALALTLALIALAALSWPLLGTATAACETPHLSISADLLAQCAVLPLVYLFGIWLLLILALLLSARSSDHERWQRRNNRRD